jgi:hypothetical protein
MSLFGPGTRSRTRHRRGVGLAAGAGECVDRVADADIDVLADLEVAQ